MNLEVLKNDVRDRLVDGLILGSNVVRWAAHQPKQLGQEVVGLVQSAQTVKDMVGEITFQDWDDAPDNMDRRLAA